MTRRPASRFVAVVLPALAALALRPDATEAASPVVFHEANVLGTSLDLTVNTQNQADADKVRAIVLDEVKRLEKILSAYEPTAELARLNATGRLSNPSQELIDVLNAYKQWRERSGGAFQLAAGSMKSLWADGKVPNDAMLAEAVQSANGESWLLQKGGDLTLAAGKKLNVDSLGKGFIVSAALAKAKKEGPTVEGILLNIGGDISATGFGTPGRKLKWTIAVADPANPAENAKPVCELRLTDLSIATSGRYARGNHLIDPRTGKPVGVNGGGKPDRAGIASVTVIAPDNATANALATSVNVLGVDEGLKLVKATPNAEALIVLNGGGRIRSENFKRYEIPRGDGIAESRIAESDGPRVPEAFVVDVALPVKPGSREGERPYVAVWIEDDQQQHVRTLAVWGDDEKWLRQLDYWSKVIKADASLISKVTRATRDAGKYELAWDGLDQQGRRVPQGQYDVWVEVNYEHQPRVGKKATIQLGDAPSRVTLDATETWDAAQVEFKAK
jgi:thiamine biosynthesis lipoprotein